MNYQEIKLAGNATKDAVKKTPKSGGEDYAEFRMAESYRKADPMFYTVRVFGRQVDAIAPMARS